MHNTDYHLAIQSSKKVRSQKSRSRFCSLLSTEFYTRMSEKWREQMNIKYQKQTFKKLVKVGA